MIGRSINVPSILETPCVKGRIRHLNKEGVVVTREDGNVPPMKQMHLFRDNSRGNNELLRPRPQAEKQ